MYKPIDVAQAYELIRESRAARATLYRTIMGMSDGPACWKLFGWVIRREFVGDQVFFAFIKRFPGQCAADAMRKGWVVDASFDHFQRVVPRIAELEVLQQLNEDLCVTYARVGRRKTSTVYLKFRIQTPEGTLTGFQSVNPGSSPHAPFVPTCGLEDDLLDGEDDDEELPERQVWVDVSLWYVVGWWWMADLQREGLR